MVKGKKQNKMNLQMKRQQTCQLANLDFKVSFVTFHAYMTEILKFKKSEWNTCSTISRSTGGKDQKIKEPKLFQLRKPEGL